MPVVLNQGKEINLRMLPPPINQPSTKIALEERGDNSAQQGVVYRMQDIAPLWQVEKRND